MSGDDDGGEGSDPPIPCHLCGAPGSSHVTDWPIHPAERAAIERTYAALHLPIPAILPGELVPVCGGCWSIVLAAIQSEPEPRRTEAPDPCDPSASAIPRST